MCILDQWLSRRKTSKCCWREKHFESKMPMEPLRSGRVRCPFCFGQFRPGFIFNRHKTNCARRHEHAAGASDGDDNNGDDAALCDEGLCVDHHPDTPPIHHGRQPPQARAFEQHLHSAQSAPGAALEYATWGPKELTAAEAETFRFLAVTDAGDGTSRRVATGTLRYARSLGGRACLLPKSMDTAWSMLTKVRHVRCRKLYIHTCFQKAPMKVLS